MTEEVALDKDVGSEPVEELQQEKMLPVSRVEELVKKAKLKGRDSMQSELEALKSENAQLKSNNGSMGGMVSPSVDVESIKKQVLDHLTQQMQEANEKRAQDELDSEAKKIAENYHSRMSAGKETYEDFDKVMADFNPAAFPNLVYLALQVDNTKDVMYELRQNPSKFASVVLLSERDPADAQRMISKISASIKANQQAKADEKTVPSPLSRLSSSTTGQDSGKKTIRDFKHMYPG